MPKSAARRAAERRRGVRRVIVTVASILGGLAIWELIGLFVVKNALFLATPTASLVALRDMWADGSLQKAMVISGEEFLIGFSIAVVAGILIGLVTASFEDASLVLTPWISGFYASPIVALAPLLILWFGVGIWSKIAVVISLVIFPMIINTEAGIKQADAVLIEAARSFGASPLQIFTKVSLPSALPYIIAGLRLGVGRGLIGVVIGELAGARGGLGYLINNASQVFNMPQLFASVIVLAAAGIALTALFQYFERVLVPWKAS
ncbi:MAG TPA: ABC transporter permease [Candidatus Lustribacter sp.]|jgi:NitT/TauT family transport system permease protein|nr:ABC transporter permease [Candidatus Lustribacter sp.]